MGDGLLNKKAEVWNSFTGSQQITSWLFFFVKFPQIQVCVEEKETFKEMFALLRYTYTLLTSTSKSRLLSKITIIDMRRFLYQGLGLHDVCHLEFLDKPWLPDPLHLCSGNVSFLFVHHTLTIIIYIVIFSSSLLCSFKGQRTEAGPDSCSRKLSCWTNWSVSTLKFLFLSSPCLNIKQLWFLRL